MDRETQAPLSKPASIAPAHCACRGAELRRFAVGAGAGCRFAKVDGVVLAYEDRGRGLPIVAMHAIGHGSRDFELVAPMLSRERRFIAFDWPGQGRSGRDLQPAGVPRYAQILGRFLDTLALDRVVLAGNSIGGAVAMAYAAGHPERVAALVLADPGGLRPIDALAHRFCGAMAALGRAGGRDAFWFKPLFALLYRQLLRTSSARAQRERIVAAAAESAQVWEQAWLHFRSPQADLTHIGARIHCPVLFTWARDDRLIPFAASKRAIERFPRHSVSFFAGGHCPHLEEPDAFVAAVQAFLRETEVRSEE